VKTFKWTAPEPNHEHSKRDAAAFEYWDRVRHRGFGWFVVSKGVLFAVVLPAVLVGYLDFTGSTEMVVLSWLAGLMAGSIVWSQREKTYERGLESGMRSRFEAND
jgi:hypothetical protein